MMRRRRVVRFPWHRVVCADCGGPIGYAGCPTCRKDPRPTLPLPILVGDVHALPAATGRLEHGVRLQYRRGSTADASRRWRQANPAKVKAYVRTRKRGDRRAESARYRAKHREAINARKRAARRPVV